MASNPPYEPRFDNTLDERIFAVVKETLENWTPDLAKIPIKDLQNRVLRNPDIEPQMLDRLYLEVEQGNLVLETGEATGAVATTGVQLVLDQAFETKPVFFTASVEPDFTYTGYAFLAAYTRHDTGNGQVVISNSTSAQTIYVKWMVIRPRS